MNRRITLDREGPCICGSGARLKECCLSTGTLYKPALSVMPEGTETGYTHPACYLRSTKNCSTTISGEHYVSRAIFNEFDGVEVGGAPWLPPGEKRRIGINSLKSNILCDRHNSALSPLDTEATRFFRTLRNIGSDLDRETLSRKSRPHLFSGTMLELWALKVACGAFFSGSAANAGMRLHDHEFNIDAALAAMNIGLWRPGAGLYIKAVGQNITASDTVGFAPLTISGEKRVCGSSISVRGLILDLVFDTTKLRLPLEGYFYRPPEIRVTNNRRAHVIYLSWPGPPSQHSIQLTLRRGRGSKKPRR